MRIAVHRRYQRVPTVFPLNDRHPTAAKANQRELFPENSLV
jgi:hypothetical protein